MKLEELCGSQKLLAGTIMAKISEETKKSLKDNDDEDTKKAMKYILTKLDEINKEIAEEVLKETVERMKRLHELILED